MPTSQNIDRQLLIGSGLFGFGWGLGGMCPVSTIADAFLSLLHDVYVIEWNQIKSNHFTHLGQCSNLLLHFYRALLFTLLQMVIIKFYSIGGHAILWEQFLENMQR